MQTLLMSKWLYCCITKLSKKYFLRKIDNGSFADAENISSWSFEFVNAMKG